MHALKTCSISTKWISILSSVALISQAIILTIVLWPRTESSGITVNIAENYSDTSGSVNITALDALLSRQSRTLDDAKHKYRLKLKRSPPKGYAEWFNNAQQKRCIIDDYDMIWEDLAPYHQLGGDEFRRRMAILKENATQTFQVKIKNGLPSGGEVWDILMKNSIKSVPNMNIYINSLDEPRILFNMDRDGPAIMTNTISKKIRDIVDEKPNWFTAAGQAHLDLMKDLCHLHSPLQPLQQPHEFHGYLQWPMSSLYSRNLLPIISQARISNCFRDILIPSIYYYYTYAGGSSQADSYPWQNRLPKAYWRGSTTGGWNQNGNWKTSHRFRLMTLVSHRPDLYNVAFTKAVQCHSNDCLKLSKEYKTVSHEPFETVYKYKYALDVDGNTFSGRFFRLLESQTLVFKATIFDEFFQRWIVPWEHYIPIEMDFSDLDQKIEWAKNNDDKARRIAENGRRFAERILNKPQMECYTELLLLEFSSLLYDVK